MNNLAQDPSFDLRDYNTMGLNAQADEVYLVSKAEGLLELLKTKDATISGELSNTLLGETQNHPLVLFRDGSILQIEKKQTHYVISVEGSCSLDKLITRLIQEGIAGMELLSGIPGTVGAGLIQNVGAYGGQISTYVYSAKAFCVHTKTESILKSSDFNFQYRQSAFKHAKPEEKHIILEATFHIPIHTKPAQLTYADLEKRHAQAQRDKENLKDIRQTVLDVRSTKGMVVNCEGWSPCVGSYFVSPSTEEAIAQVIAEKVRGKDFAQDFLKWYRPDASQVRVPAALVLRAAGFLNGDSWGNVGLNKKHILALTAFPQATGSDVANLAHYIKMTVKEKLGITLNQEIIHLGAFSNLQNPKDFIKKNPLQAGISEPSWVCHA